MRSIVIGSIDKLIRPDGTQEVLSMDLPGMYCEHNGIAFSDGIVRLAGYPMQEAAYCKVGEVAFIVADEPKRQALLKSYDAQDGTIYDAIKSVVAQFLAEHPDVLPDMLRKQYEAGLQRFVSGKLSDVQNLVAA